MSKNEKTSKRVAAIAGRVLAVQYPHTTEVRIYDIELGEIRTFKWAELRSLAASALTQADDKPKKARG